MVTALPLLLFMAPACDFGKPAGDETAPPLDTAAPAPVDDDGDGWSEPEDCDDADPEVHPQAAEVCNGKDDDCDGTVDVAAVGAGTWYPDVDADGYGDPGASVIACDAPTGFIADGRDCDDADPAQHPDAEEHCNGEDDDCDGDIDEEATDAATWYADRDSDGYGDPASDLEACAAPPTYVADATDCDDADPDRNPAAAERCDGLDDDCDGDVDEDLIETWYPDSDGDGYGDPASAMTTCDPPSGWVSDATDCDDGDATSATTACTAPSGTVSDDTDCDDASMTTHPGAEEICGDGLDNDCDGLVDEGDTAAPEDTGPGGDTGAPCAGATACPSDMVLVGSCFCIDVYEASRPDATATSAGLDSSCAVSQAGVRPWQVSSNADAATACAAAGKRLCSEAEWYEACAGPTDTDYTYGDAYDAAACNGLDTHCTCADGSVYEDCFFDCGGSFYLLPTGSLSACTNGWGVYDMSGNLWEHVDGGDDSTVRGGAYNCGDTPSYHRCSYIPTTWTPSARGFRCCSDGI